MAWIRLDDGLPQHPKIAKAGPEAAWLYVASLCYCNRYLTNGLIPQNIVPKLTAFPEAIAYQFAKTLVELCLWVAREDGDFEVHDYLEYQESKEHILALRETRKEVGRLGGLAKAYQKPTNLVSKSPSKTLAKVYQKEEEEEDKEHRNKREPSAPSPIPKKKDLPQREHVYPDWFSKTIVPLHGFVRRDYSKTIALVEKECSEKNVPPGDVGQLFAEYYTLNRTRLGWSDPGKSFSLNYTRDLAKLVGSNGAMPFQGRRNRPDGTESSGRPFLTTEEEEELEAARIKEAEHGRS